MIGFESPRTLLLALPWLLLWWLFARRQRRAWDWVAAHVAPRFRGLLTAHSRRSLGAHLLLLALMGLLLIAAAAGPFRRGRTEARADEVRLVLLVDGSASMLASDLGADWGAAEPPAHRLEAVRQVALALVERLPRGRFALASFAGVAAIHLPMVSDRELVASALRNLEVHGFYQTTGSSLARALDVVPHFLDDAAPGLQAVLLSDGEQPYPEPFDEPLAVLAERGVPVHGVAIGSVEGQARVIYDFRDVIAGKEEKRVLREYTTRREDVHLRRIARDTGGVFEVGSARTAARLADEIVDRATAWRPLAAPEAGQDLSWLPLALFLAGLLLDGLLIGRRRRPASFGFEIERLGKRAAAAALGLLLVGATVTVSACDRTPRARAGRENEAGIALDAVGGHRVARVHYERSAGYGVEPWIPTHNQGRSATLAEDHAEAHRLYQEALKLAPDLAPAFYNDGVALYRWGAAERDPRDCELERTLDLWQQARRRFRDTLRVAAPSDELARRARRNLDFLAAEIAEVERLIADPPEECRPPPQPSSGGGTGGGAADGGDQEAPPGGAAGGGEEPRAGGAGGGGGEQPDGGGTPENEGDRPRGEGDLPEERDRQPAGEGDQPDGGQPEGEGDQPEGEQPEGEGDEQRGGADGPEGDEQEPQRKGDEPRGGGVDGPQPPPSGGGLGPRPLTETEREQIGRELERIAQQAVEPGKFYRRTLPEQFPPEHWQNPDPIIWW